MKKIKKQAILLLFTLIFTIILCSAVSAVDPLDPLNVYVSPTGNDTDGDGSSNKPYQTIQWSLGKVNNTGTIHLARGTYNSSTTNHKDYDLNITKNITIAGAGKDKTFINAGGNAGIFEIYSDTTVTIKDITFLNASRYAGKQLYVGSAISNSGKLTIINCKFENNTASGGSAIYSNEYVTIINSIFKNNKAVDSGNGGIGPAIFNSGTCIVTGSKFEGNVGIGRLCYGGAIYGEKGTLTVTGCNFTNNLAGQGGAIYIWDGSLRVSNSIFTDNIADGDGGAIYGQGDGIYIPGDHMVITDSKFSGNKVFDGWGGAISNNWCALTVLRCIFTSNTAYRGGAIYNSDSSSNITGCNFNHNVAVNNGGAIYGYNGDSNSALNVKYSRFVGNMVGTAAQDIYMQHQSLDAKYNWWGSNNGPSASRVTGDENSLIEYTPWLVLNFKADSSTIKTGQTSKLTANVYTDSDGTDHSSDASMFFSGPEITFTTDIGNVGSKSVTVPWTLGSAFAILRGDEGPGLATLTAGDIQTLQTQINIEQGINPVDPGSQPGNSSGTSKVNAANKTIGMQKTGLPLVGLVLAVLMLFGGFITSKK